MKQDTTKDQPKKSTTGRWTQEQHLRFMQAIMLYGNNWKKVQQMVQTRSGSQVRSHAQKFFIKLKKQQDAKKKGGVIIQKPQQNAGQEEGSQYNCSHLLRGQFSNITPPQAISQIFKDQAKQGSEINIYEIKNELAQKMKSIQSQEKQKQAQQQSKRKKQKQKQTQKKKNQLLNPNQKYELNQYRNLSNLLSVYESTNGQDKRPEQLVQNQSFLLTLIKKYKNLLLNTDGITNLIDFGKEDAQNYQRSIRKRSFELPEGVQGSQQDLNERKKRILTETCTSKLTQQQRESYKQRAAEQGFSQNRQQQQKNYSKQKNEKFSQVQQNKENNDKQIKDN